MVRRVCAVARRMGHMSNVDLPFNLSYVAGNLAQITRPIPHQLICPLKQLGGMVAVGLTTVVEAMEATTHGTFIEAGTKARSASRTTWALSATITRGHIVAMTMAITSNAIPIIMVAIIVEVGTLGRESPSQ